MLGAAVGSKALDPSKENNTDRVNVDVGVDSSTLLNPTFKTTLAGSLTVIYTPSFGTAFVQGVGGGAPRRSEIC